jgi:DNA-binding NarL/FixJ family response regulator
MESLTPRQLAVVRLVSQGLTTRRIARELGLSAPTVESHIRAAMDRVDAPTRICAAASLTPALSDECRPSRLAPEERRLLGLLAGGATLTEAAGLLNVSRRTCSRRLTAVKAKLGTPTTVQAVLAASRHHASVIVVGLVVAWRELEMLAADDGTALLGELPSLF